jgi:hypothetical protein
LLSRLPDDIENNAAIFMRRRDIEEAEFIRSGFVIDARLFDRIAGITQVKKVHAFDDATVFNIKAGNDAGFEHPSFLQAHPHPSQSEFDKTVRQVYENGTFQKRFIMLNAPQVFSIEALPAEGGCFYYKKGEKIPYDQEAAKALSELPLAGKIAPASKQAIILHGAPGSGKSVLGYDRLLAEHGDTLQNTAIISYDEHGAIYDIPEYVGALKDIVPEFEGMHRPLSPERGHETMAARHQLWLDFQPLSQHIRSLTLKEALRRELSLFVDTTSSSPGVFKQIELLRDLDFTNVEVWSTHGPLDLAKDRIVGRARPTSGHDYLVKRAGAYETLPRLCSAADRLVMTLNDDAGLPPVDMMVLEAGCLKSLNRDALTQFTDRLLQDLPEFYDLTKNLPEVKDLDFRYFDAVSALKAHLEEYSGNKPSAPAPGPHP